MLDLVSIDFADLCGGGVINSQCQDPGHDIYFRLTTYTSDGTSIATQDNLLSEGVSGGFNTFSFPSPLFDGVPVGKIEISAQSGNLAYLQIDNLVFEPSPVPVPPAFWLFGSGLLGLVGIARRKKDA